MTAVDPNGQVHITFVEGDRVVQVARGKISQSLRIHVNEWVHNMGVTFTKTARDPTDQSTIIAKEGSSSIARAMTSSKDPQIRSHMSHTDQAQ